MPPPLVRVPPRGRLSPWQVRILIALGISLLLLAPLVWIMARRLTRPIRVFAEAAERLGADPDAAPMVASGPTEVRTAIHAFNDMQAALRDHMRRRSQTVAAIAHDLRTPLTRLRFRAEQAPDSVRDRMAADIEEMDALIATAMAYVRANMPSDAGVNVLWGDPTPSNVMFSADGQVNALIDWELAALGPAELDLAWWLYFDDLFGRRFGVTRLEGLPSRDETIAIWEAASGQMAQHLDYYDIVAALRMALVAVGAFDRQVGIGNIPVTNRSLQDNFMTLYLAEKLGLPIPELGPDFAAFMQNLVPLEDKAA